MKPANQNTDLSSEDLLRSLGSNGMTRGFTVDESRLRNPVTGEIVPMHNQNIVLVNPHTGATGILNSCTPVQCKMGCVIEEGADLAFCYSCGFPTCPSHSIVDPVCGRVFCLECSRMITVNGLALRICFDCYTRMRQGWWRRFLRFLFGRG